MSFLNENIIQIKNIVKSFYIDTPNQLDILKNKVHKLEGKTIILITHNIELAEETERIITIKDGKIVSEQYNDTYIKRFPSGKKVCL